METNIIDIKAASFLSLLGKGDKVAFESLFRLYYPKLVHVAKGYLINKDNAEEIVQNIFAKLWENKSKLKKIKNINNYLYVATKNACLNHFKHEKVKRDYYNKVIIHQEFFNDDAADLLLENELKKKIIAGVQLLPEKCRNVFYKSRFEGLKNLEIAEVLGISKKTVDNHISFALKHMKLHLRDFLSLLFLFFSF